jgi:hypothetical protein
MGREEKMVEKERKIKQGRERQGEKNKREGNRKWKDS